MLGRSRNIGRAQRGDTIVEVLIAVAVISLILAVSYAITNRNLATTQDTNERNQALQQAQKQVELLRTYSVADSTGQTTGALPTDTTPFCMTGGTAFSKQMTSDCQIDAVGAACNTGTGSVCYEESISLISAASNPAVYEVTVTWDSLTGAKSAVVLDYQPTSS